MELPSVTMGKDDKTHNHYSAANPALQTLRSHEAETPVTPFHTEDSDERAQRNEAGTSSPHVFAAAAQSPMVVRFDQSMEQPSALRSCQKFYETTATVLTKGAKRRQIQTRRGGTRHTRVQADWEEDEMQGHRRSAANAEWMSRSESLWPKVPWLPCVASGVIKTNMSTKLVALVPNKPRMLPPAEHGGGHNGAEANNIEIVDGLNLRTDSDETDATSK